MIAILFYIPSHLHLLSSPQSVVVIDCDCALLYIACTCDCHCHLTLPCALYKLYACSSALYKRSAWQIYIIRVAHCL